MQFLSAYIHPVNRKIQHAYLPETVFFLTVIFVHLFTSVFILLVWFVVFVTFFSLFSLFLLIQLQLEVHEAKPVPENHPQWDTAIEGDEDQEDSEGFEDSFEEEEEEEEDDD